MADQKLTQRVYLETSNDDDIVHIVQDGASYKQKKINFLKDVVSTTSGGTRLISGGMVWKSGLTYKSVNLSYEINGLIFNIADDTEITLDAADLTDPRIDLIYGDDTGALGVSTGTPAPIPTANTLPSYQLQLKIALVASGATTPTGTAIRTVYLENLQEVGGEFDTSETTSGARIDLENTTTPIEGTKDIKVIASLSNADTITFTHTTPTTFANFNSLELSIKNLAAWGNDYIVLDLFDGANIARSLTINSSKLNTSDVTNTQNITFFKNDFNIASSGITEFDTIRILNRIVGSSAMRYQLDEIYINEDTYSVEPVTINSSDITVDTSNFNNNLTSADDTVQKALDTLDDLSVAVGSVEGTAILSTGEVGGTKFLREDGDGTCSWQDVSGESITASNGLTRTADDIALGGTLSTNKTIDTGGFTLNVNNTTDNSAALSVFNSQSGTALSVTSSGGTAPAIQSQGNLGYAFFGFNSSDSDTYPVIGTLKNNNNTNTADAVLSLGRSTFGTPANGIGASLEYKVETSTTSAQYAGSLDVLWSDVTHATRTSQFKVDLVNSSSNQTNLTVNGDGSTQLNQYGSGTITGTPAYALQVDSSGNVIEVPIHETIGIACSDETTDLAVTTGVCEFQMPFAMTLTNVIGTVTTAPTGSTIIVDINDGGTSIMTTNKISIDATEKTSETAATPPTLTDTALAKDAVITVDIDQIGSTVAGTGLKIWLIGTRT